jgi:AmiR/NasT family two-component response regulator
MTTIRPPSPRIHEAAQIIAEQLGCDEDEAMTRLRERAEYGQYRLHNYAVLVVDGIVKFDE